MGNHLNSALRSYLCRRSGKELKRDKTERRDLKENQALIKTKCRPFLLLRAIQINLTTHATVVMSCYGHYK